MDRHRRTGEAPQRLARFHREEAIPHRPPAAGGPDRAVTPDVHPGAPVHAGNDLLERARLLVNVEQTGKFVTPPLYQQASSRWPSREHGDWEQTLLNPIIADQHDIVQPSADFLLIETDLDDLPALRTSHHTMATPAWPAGTKFAFLSGSQMT